MRVQVNEDRGAPAVDWAVQCRCGEDFTSTDMLMEHPEFGEYIRTGDASSVEKWLATCQKCCGLFSITATAGRLIVHCMDAGMTTTFDGWQP